MNDAGDQASFRDSRHLEAFRLPAPRHYTGGRDTTAGHASEETIQRFMLRAEREQPLFPETDRRP